jgi:two-component system OmpR family response regulator
MATKTKKKSNPTIPDRQLIQMQPYGDSGATYILFVHPYSDLSASVVQELEGQSYNVRSIPDIETCLITVKQNRFDLILIDCAEPFINFVTLIKSLRQDGVICPIISVSSPMTETERIAILGVGCDATLFHPVSIKDIVSQVNAHLLSPRPKRETLLRIGPLELDLIERTAYREGRKIQLLAREFKLLEYMMRRPAQVLSRATLLEDVWNYRFEAETNLVDVHMGKLRKKIDGASQSPMIHTIKGFGFMLSSSA